MQQAVKVASSQQVVDVAKANEMYFQHPLKQLTVIQHALYQVVLEQDPTFGAS